MWGMQETWVRSLGWEGPLEEEMATHSNILAWKIPWTEEPGGLQSVGSQRVDTTKQLSTHTCMQGRCVEVLYPSKNSGHFILHPQHMHMHMHIHIHAALLSWMRG